jgi:hypothetical protein
VVWPFPTFPVHHVISQRPFADHPVILTLLALPPAPQKPGLRVRAKGRNDGPYVSGMLETWSRNAFRAAIAAYQRSKFSNAGRSGTSSR